MSNPDVHEDAEASDDGSVDHDQQPAGDSGDMSDGDTRDLSHNDTALAEFGDESSPEDEADAVEPPAGETASGSDLSVEALVADLERVTGERNQYLEASQRLQAEFENYRKQVARREADSKDRANDGLITELLPVLDAFDGAVASGVDAVDPMRVTMLETLAKNGLERIDPAEAPFDPNHHEAVMHEEGGDGSGPMVAEVMRAGYLWKGRVLRPAMVKVIG